MKVEEAIDAALDAVTDSRFAREQIIASLRANGYAVVPVEATEKMSDAAANRVGQMSYADVWRVMLRASQENDDGR